MQFDANTPRAPRTIAGQSLTVIAPFAEGMTLTEALAAILNQTIAENISNNTRKAIEAAVAEGADNAALQALVDNYMAEYEPGVRRSGGGEPRVTDPVEREARKLAKTRVLEVVKTKGLKAKEIDVAGLTEKLFEANRDRFMEQGKAVVKALEKAKAGSEGLDLGDIAL